jgi:hypothetical protein
MLATFIERLPDGSVIYADSETAALASELASGRDIEVKYHPYVPVGSPYAITSPGDMVNMAELAFRIC